MPIGGGAINLAQPLSAELLIEAGEPTGGGISLSARPGPHMDAVDKFKLGELNPALGRNPNPCGRAGRRRCLGANRSLQLFRLCSRRFCSDWLFLLLFPAAKQKREHSHRLAPRCFWRNPLALRADSHALKSLASEANSAWPCRRRRAGKRWKDAFRPAKRRL